MSQELNSIKGKIEFIKKFDTKEVGYKDELLHITSFYGGDERGRCLQLSIGESHIQITKENARKLIKEVTNWLL